MKIISKWKDYYDYIQGIYGTDPILVLDRRTDQYIVHADLNPVDYNNKPIAKTYHFAICGKYYMIHTYKGKIYHTLEEVRPLYKKGIIRSKYYTSTSKNITKDYWESNYIGKTDENIKQREPILVQGNYSRTYTKAVILNEFKFGSIIPASDIFTMISNFLGYLKDNPEKPNNQTNDQKIESHGFDRKISFRHRKS